MLDRVSNGEAFVVTRDGTPVAELRPIPPQPTDAMTLLARWKRLPPVDAATFRQDLDEFLNPDL